MKPLIGISSDINPGDREDYGGKEPTYFLRARYVNAIKDLGGIPIVLPISRDNISEMLSFLDGLLITGSGPDIDPVFYNEKKISEFKIMCKERTEFEIDLIRQARLLDKPILGICGGMQTINVAFGGSLIQDIRSEIANSIEHNQGKSYDKPYHVVNIKDDTKLKRILTDPSLPPFGKGGGTGKIMVNSSHHQSIKQTSPDFTVNAISDDGIIEGIESDKERYVLGVQWHPEYLYEDDINSRNIFLNFLKEAKRSK